MRSSFLSKWFNRYSQLTSRRNDWRRFKPVLESLERRDLPSTVTWIHPTSGDWDTPANWSTGSIPTAADDVQINQAGITVSHSASRNDYVHSLTSKAAINLSGGQLYLGGTSSISGALKLSNGTITGPGNLTIGGLFTWSGGTMSGDGTTIANGGISFNSTGSPFALTENLNSRTLNNAGTAVWCPATSSSSLPPAAAALQTVGP
jgi:hypothetical protein